MVLSLTIERPKMFDIQSSARVVLSLAYLEKKLSSEPAIWYNLDCEDIAVAFDMNGNVFYILTIRRASPNADKLARFVQERLELLYPDKKFTVRCEW